MNKKSENNQKNQRIQVFARCRPLNTSEKKSSSSVIEVIPEKKIVVKDRNASREFFFDKVFPPDTKQISVYKAVVAPLIQEVLMGYNCTVFAYGQTGTGKTYTMEGERNNSKCSWEDDPGAGIIPRSLHQLFEDLNKEDKMEFSVRVSFLELYNEELFDLLSSTELSRLRLFEDSSKKGSVIIQGLEEIVVNSKDEVYSILEKGTARRQTAATMLNATSSRSHTVFSVTVHIKENTIEGEELLKTGKLNLVDLAGSENVGRSGAVDKRAREAGNINQSLLTLGRVITALIEKQPHVPYRESKLTRLLQDSLGGHTKTSIIATISPALCNFDETLSTLDYATKAKSITIKPEINQKMTKRALIREYTEEIERLQKDLVALRSNQGFFIDMDNYTSLLNERAEKNELIKEYTERIEELKEKIAKVEEMFTVTKEELMVTSEKLNETSKKYEETAVKLSNTTDALAHTQKVLTQTTLEKDEKQFLINIQRLTEKRLSQQAQKILQVADETTNDVDKLHSKIDRKTTVEKTNEERCKEFRTMYQRQFAMLDDLVSQAEKQQTADLLKTKEDMDKAFQFLLNHQIQTTDSLNQFVSLMVSNIEKLSETHSSGVDCQVKWTNSLLDELSNKKEILFNKQCSFLLDKLPEFSQEMNKRCSDMKEWILTVHKHLLKKIESRKEVLCKRSEGKRKLIFSVKESLNSLRKNFEDILNDFEEQSSSISLKENQFAEDLDKAISYQLTSLSALQKLAEHRKEIEQNSTNRNKYFKTNVESNLLKIDEKNESLMQHDDSEHTHEEDKEFFDQMLINIDEFSIKHASLNEIQVEAVNEFETFTKENQKDEKKLFSEIESSVKSNLSFVSENAMSLNSNVTIVNRCLEDYANSEKETNKKNIEEIQKIMSETGNDINESEKHLSAVASCLKGEILKRDIELEKFISEDLLKDIPTGTTPQRKSYSYPRLLAATSPHDRIIDRYRSKLAADTAAAVNLPLNSSFNELDESSLSLNKSSDGVSNLSYSSDDCESDSCASSMSDASVESEKNKENQKNLKKKSRLPKRLPNKFFAKPALPVPKKPLGLTNSTSTE